MKDDSAGGFNLDISKALEEFDMSHLDFGDEKRELELTPRKIGW